MPILQVVEFEGGRFHGKYFAGVHGLETGRGGPVLVDKVTDAKIMPEQECRQMIEDLAAWHTFKMIEGSSFPVPGSILFWHNF